mgnify:FL=1
MEHPNLDGVEKEPMTVADQETNIKMGDGTSKYEIVYATFTLTEEDFSAVRYCGILPRFPTDSISFPMEANKLP